MSSIRSIVGVTGYRFLPEQSTPPDAAASLVDASTLQDRRRKALPGELGTRDDGVAATINGSVMRHQPAHMSRDTDVDDSRCASPAEPNPANKGADGPCAVDNPHSI